jgi:hypothetical protein
MKFIKKYNESKSHDFIDKEYLDDILIEFSDLGLNYTIKYKAFKIFDDENFMPVGGELPEGFGNIKQELYRGYQVSFPEFYKDGYFATDIQRGENQRIFARPNDKFYKFFRLVSEVQSRIESMGFIFLLSTHKHAEFDFMIIENK